MKEIEQNGDPEEALSNGTPDSEVKKAKKEANAIIAFGGGVGAVGIGSSIVLGATCPLCIFIAPTLIGLGIYKRWKCKT